MFLYALVHCVFLCTSVCLVHCEAMRILVCVGALWILCSSLCIGHCVSQCNIHFVWIHCEILCTYGACFGIFSYPIYMFLVHCLIQSIIIFWYIIVILSVLVWVHCSILHICVCLCALCDSLYLW